MTSVTEHRPLIHFTPEKGWINDPNGMAYINGEYHLFYQHYPDGVTWGPMYWGHAVSKDLLHWEHYPIAIYPDELGVIFSGSGFYDKNNLSGLGSKDIPFFGIKGKSPYIAMYTNHNTEIINGEMVHTEQQSIAYSTDLRHFEKYYGNPVLPNPGKKDFRDPKMFWNPVKNCVSMVLAAGDRVEFYASKDFKNWEKTGEFIAGIHGRDGICECPDCFPVIAEDGTEKWVLFISMIVPEEKKRKENTAFDRLSHISQYYLGDFDGDTFVDTEKADVPLILDYGTDNYAPVTFQNLDEKVMIGWANNWEYARKCQMTGEYNGCMTLGRRIELKKTAEGYRLCYFFEGLEGLRSGSWKMKAGVNRLRSDSFGLRVTGGTNGKITMYNQNGEEITVELTEEEIIVDRCRAGRSDFSELFSMDVIGRNRAPRKHKEDAGLEFVWDVNVFEMIADQNETCFTVIAYPENRYENLRIDGDLQIEMYEINR